MKFLTYSYLLNKCMKFNELVNILMEKCWKGYEQKGTKKKGKRIVPNCVKKKSSTKKA